MNRSDIESVVYDEIVEELNRIVPASAGPMPIEMKNSIAAFALKLVVSLSDADCALINEQPNLEDRVREWARVQARKARTESLSDKAEVDFMKATTS